MCRFGLAIFKFTRRSAKLITSHGRYEDFACRKHGLSYSLLIGIIIYSQWWNEFREIVHDSDINYDEFFRVSFRWRYAMFFKRSKLEKQLFEFRYRFLEIVKIIDSL